VKTLTRTEEEETIISNCPDRSTYPEEKSVSRSGATPETAIRTHKLLTLGAALGIVAVEAFVFTHASTDDIGTPWTMATAEVMTTDSSSGGPS
jgi:hypothetical protein